jgi:hypothetical protein
MSKLPLFKTWNQWYVFVLAFLALLIACFVWITNYFS